MTTNDDDAELNSRLAAETITRSMHANLFHDFSNKKGNSVAIKSKYSFPKKEKSTNFINVKDKILFRNILSPEVPSTFSKRKRTTNAHRYQLQAINEIM